MMTPEQSRAARGLLDWSQRQLSVDAKVGLQTVVDFERGVRTPRYESLRSMQNTFEQNAITFTTSSNNEPAVLLGHSIWRLTPIDRASMNWKASTFDDVVIIRAHSERRAREIASLAFGLAVRNAPGSITIINPWGRIIGEVICDRLDDSRFDAIGREAILTPEVYDSEWK